MLKQKILELREKGFSYRQIQDELGCSRGTISYHLGKGQKEKTRLRKIKHLKKHPYISKINHFLYDSRKNTTSRKKGNTKIRRLIYDKIKTFRRTKTGGNMENSFTVEDVIEKFGESPTCYLTGTKIDINKPRSYQFDHIIPKSRGGQNTLDNLGICTKQVNQSKRDMTPDEYINLCKTVLENNGYTITPK